MKKENVCGIIQWRNNDISARSVAPYWNSATLRKEGRRACHRELHGPAASFLLDPAPV